MKSLISLGVIFFLLSFCGLTEKLKQLSGGANANTATAPSKNSKSDVSAEKPKLTSEQQAIQDAATETKWDDQGISWKLPKGWVKMDITKDQFVYQGTDSGYLIVSISVLGDNFPMDVSLKAYYDQAMQQLKNGKYESVKLVEIDGLTGVEFTEAPPANNDDVRRHQWIGYRRYLGQNQQVNVITSSNKSSFEKHKDEFPAILYSMRSVK